MKEIAPSVVGFGRTRLSLSVIAYNPGNLWKLAMPLPSTDQSPGLIPGSSADRGRLG